MARGSVVSIMIGALTSADQLLVERLDILHLVAIGGLQADVDDVRAVLHLLARDLRRLFPFLFGDQVLEGARADDVGALADDQRAIAVFRLHQLDAGIVSAVRPEPSVTRGFLPSAICAMAWMCCVGGAAAAADQVQPAVRNEPLQLLGQGLGRLEVFAVSFGNPALG